MTPEEQYNALVTEKNIAEDNVNRINRDIEKYVKVIEGYSKLDAATQEKMAPQMQQVLERYNNLKNERYAQEDRYWVALNNINNYQAQAQAQAQAQQTPTRAPWTRRKIEVPTEPYPVQSLPNWQIRMSDWSIVGGYSPAPRTQPTQSTNQPTASTFKNAAYWAQNGIATWVWENLVYPYMQASSWLANKLGLISDDEREQNKQTIREVWKQAYNDSPDVNKDSKAYIYANEWTQALWDAAKYTTMAALWARALPVRTAPTTTPTITNLGLPNYTANPGLPNYTAIIPWPNGWYILWY